MTDVRTQIRAAERLLRIKKAPKDYFTFVQLLKPDPNDPGDATKSTFLDRPFPRALARAMEDIASGKRKRLIVNVPPRHGKTELTSRLFIPWFMGRNPTKHVIFTGYSDVFAQDIGRDVRTNMRNPAFKQVFPNCSLEQGSEAAARLRTTFGGMMYFVGAGGAITGRGGDLVIVDDPIKNSEEANSVTTREKLWTWFNNDVMSRFMTDEAAILLIQCMTGDTSVMMADGSTRALRDIRPGDEIATYDDGALGVSTVRAWRNNGPDEVFEIKTASGAIVRANARHPFLVETENGPRWIRTKNLRPGLAILRVAGESGKASSAKPKGASETLAHADTARRTTTKSDGPTAFDRRRIIPPPSETQSCATATAFRPRTTIGFWLSRAARALSANNRQATTSVPTGAENSASTTVTILAASAHFCATIATWLSGMQRQPKSPSQLPITSDFTPDPIVSIRRDGVEEVFDLQVDRTANFIANGLVSHNTRWHEDDIPGRLTDPTNPCYNEEEAKLWQVINMPALAEDADDPLGRKAGEPLFPERQSLELLLSAKRRDPVAFSALYQQRPSPPDGSFFKSDMLRTYASRGELPQGLRIYAASDHAVATKQNNDRTCMIVVGVDSKDVIWLLDVFWDRKPVDFVVEKMMEFMRTYKPVTWFAEQDHIAKSIAPFLKKRMSEEKIYCHIDESKGYPDKVVKAQPILGRMSMGMVRFPAYATWWSDARDEMLKFPRARHDDFVDTLSSIGRGLDKILTGKKPDAPEPVAKIGTMKWIKEESKRREASAWSFAGGDGW